MKKASVVAALLSVSVAAAFAEEKTSACQAAFAPVNYGTAIKVPPDVRTLIDSYRADWQSFCTDNHDHLSLADLFEKGKDIQKKILPILETASNSATDPSMKEAEAVHEAVSTFYPKFVPAFRGSYIEYEYFQPSIDEFKANVARGTAEDKAFFQSGLSSDSGMSPWIEPTWDYGGCTKFGSFDWVGTFKKIKELKTHLKRAVYLGEVAKFEQELNGALVTNYSFCACDDGSAVEKDLKTVLKFLQNDPAMSELAGRVANTIHLIESNQVEVKSEKEKHCSGG